MRCLKCVYNAKVAYVNWSCIAVHGLSDYSVIYPKYVLYGFAFANAFNLYHLLILNGGSLGTSVIFILMVHLNKFADSKMIAQVDIFAT